MRRKNELERVGSGLSLFVFALGVGLIAPALSAKAAPPGLMKPVLTPASKASTTLQDQPSSADDLVVVNCLLPGRTRGGGDLASRVSAFECRKVGGRYVDFERAGTEEALAVWLGEAERGSPEAQFYVGQIWERGLGQAPDYAKAADWYGRAAARDYEPAMLHLAYLYENGLGLEQDAGLAMNLYRKASGLPDELTVVDQEHQGELRGLRSELTIADMEVGGLRLALEASEKQLERSLAEGTDVRKARREVKSRRKELEKSGRQMEQLQVQIARLEADQLHAAVVRSGFDPTADPAMTRGLDNVRTLDFGSFHALVIGIETYDHLDPLSGAVREAGALADVLERHYDFEVQRLFNPTRYEILTALNDLRSSLSVEDNLLIYFAGRSVTEGDRSWWQPSDADSDSRANWLSSRTVSDHIDVIPARHVLVVADAAYGGVLTRSSVPLLPQDPSDPRRIQYVRQMLDKRSRLLLTAIHYEGNGLGAMALTSALSEVLGGNERVLEASSLYLSLHQKLQPSDKGAALVFAPIRWVRADAGAEFFFVPTN